MKFFLLSILIVLTSCGRNAPVTERKDTPDWRLADKIYDNEIAKKVFAQLRKDKSVNVCESGWGLRGKGKIQVMHFAFHYFNELDINQAREIILKAGGLYLKEINNNERIRPFLATYPFTSDNIEILIIFSNPDHTSIAYEKLHMLSIRQGILKYYSRDADTKYYGIIYQETYQEAEAQLATRGSSRDDINMTVDSEQNE